MTALDDEWSPAGARRELQEQEIAFMHQLSEVEHALAAEAGALSRMFEEVGIEFDPMTFVALSFVNECFDTQIDPVDVLAEIHGLGVLERAVDIANEIRPGDDIT
jgi:hypothetical protein